MPVKHPPLGWAGSNPARRIELELQYMRFVSSSQNVSKLAELLKMRHQRQFTPCQFIPYRLRSNIPKNAVAYDVSSYADHPWCTLSPMWAHGGIPVPGMQGTVSDSVEGIWQGLKIIDGSIAPSFFKRWRSFTMKVRTTRMSMTQPDGLSSSSKGSSQYTKT